MSALEPTSRPPELVSLLAASHDRFLSFVERRVGSRAVAEDILQDAFVRGLERGDSVRDSESAVAWFYRVLRNAITDHFRHAGAEERALTRVAARESGAAEPDPELHEVACQCISDLLAALKPEYAEVIRGVDLEEMTLTEYAERAAITPNNASVRLHRAHAALRKAVSDACRTCAEHACYDCQCKR